MLRQGVCRGTLAWMHSGVYHTWSFILFFWFTFVHFFFILSIGWCLDYLFIDITHDGLGLIATAAMIVSKMTLIRNQKAYIMQYPLGCSCCSR